MSKISQSILVTKASNGYIISRKGKKYVVKGDVEDLQYILSDIFEVKLINKLKDDGIILMEFEFEKNPPKSV